MKQITFRELLNLIYDNKAPELIKYKSTCRQYQRTQMDYIDIEGVPISRVIGEREGLLLEEMVYDKRITIYEEILTTVEKDYLSNLIKPFKESVKYIAKVETKGQERIQICYKDYLDNKSDALPIDANCINSYTFFGLPTFKAGTMYCGMELDRQYTLDELGL